MIYSVKIKLLHKEAKIPSKGYFDDAGYDLYSVEQKIIEPLNFTEVNTGIAIEMPNCLYAEIHSRSGLRSKGIFPPVGIIDPGYRGDLRVILYNFTNKRVTIKRGSRIAQLIFKPRVDISFIKVNSLSLSKRGSNGFGSTGV